MRATILAAILLAGVAQADDPEAVKVGTAIFLNREGQLLTNRHVVDGCRSLTLRSWNNKIVPAELVAESKTLDMAVIRAVGFAPDEFAWIRTDETQSVGIAVPEDRVIYGGNDLDDFDILDVGNGTVIAKPHGWKVENHVSIMASGADYGASGAGVFEWTRGSLVGVMFAAYLDTHETARNHREGDAYYGDHIVEFYSSEAIVKYLQTAGIDFYVRANPKDRTWESTKEHVFKVSTLVVCQ